jgi:ornithine cyclodeaminase/alanine dehydrogenase-like protein (mu-crystallin family)
MLILTESDLRALVTMRDVIDEVERGFRAFGDENTSIPERLHLDVPTHDGVLLEMPAYADLDGRGVLGTKIVSVFPHNTGRALDIIQSAYLLLDGETGVPLSLMEGKFITAIRTAATSAVATRHMASPGSKRLAVFGAGLQSQFHIEAMIEVAEIELVMIASRSENKARALAERVRRIHNLPCEIATPERAASAANLICTCTSSPVPLFDGRLLTAGTHINSVGAFTPSTRELDTEAVLRARVIIDAETAAGREAGEILVPIAAGVMDAGHVKGTLADVILGKIAGRGSNSEITLFKSCGFAIEDLVTARLAYDRAIARGVGARIEMSGN